MTVAGNVIFMSIVDYNSLKVLSKELRRELDPVV